MEPLEDRRLLAVLTESGTTLTIDLNVPGEELKIFSYTDSPAAINLAYAVGTSSSTFDFSSITAGRIKTLGSGFAITRAGQAAYDTIHIIDSAQDTRVVFGKSNTSAPWTENVTVTFDDDTSVAPGAQASVHFDASGKTFPFDTNNLTISTTRDIEIEFGTSITSSSGNISMSANAAGTTTGSFAGIGFGEIAAIITGTGTVSLEGHGGTDDVSNFGISVSAGAVRSGSGNIFVKGTGGGRPGSSGNPGINMNGPGYSGFTVGITSASGNVTVIGQGGASDGNRPSEGVLMSNRANISTGGTGLVTVTGTGGAGSASFNHGIALANGSAITSASGGVVVTGQGGGTGGSGDNLGVTLNLGGRISTTSGGTITINGTGGGGTGGDNIGVGMIGTAAIQIVIDGSGALTINGTAGTGPSNQPRVAVDIRGTNIQSSGGPILINGVKAADGIGGDVKLMSAQISSSGGAIAIRSDQDILGEANGNISSGGGTITLIADQDGSGAPNDAGTIQMVGDLTAGTGTVTMSLTDTDGYLNGNIVSAGSVVKEGPGTLQLNGTNNAYTGATTVNAGALYVNGAVTATSGTAVNSGGTLGGTGSIANTVTVNGGGTITGGTLTDEGTLTVGGLSFNGGTYHADLQGNKSDTIVTAGAVDLNAGAQGIFDLNVLGGGTGAGGTYTFIDNQSAAAIVDPPFRDPASNQITEGSTTTVNGQNATYSYLAPGGTGDDFALTVDPAPFISYTDPVAGTNTNFQLIRTATDVELWSGVVITVTPAGAIQVDRPTGATKVAFGDVNVIQYVSVNGNGGSDNLVIDYTGVAGLEDVSVAFAGGGALTNSGLYLSGGTFGRVEYAYLNAHDGLIGNFDDAAGTTLRSLVFYTGLAPITNTGTVTDVVFDLPTSGNVQAILEDDGTTGNTLTRLRSNPVAFEQTDFANPSGTVTINRGSATDDLRINAVPDFTAGLTIGEGTAPFDQLTVAGAMTLAGDKNLTGDATSIEISGGSTAVALSGNGAATLTAVQKISMTGGATLSTVDGDISMSANTAGTATGPSVGIYLGGSTVQSTGSGDVSLTGRGSGTGDLQFGVELAFGGKVLGGSGTVTVNGTGSTGTGSFSHGVYVTNANSQINSTGGDVIVTGQGGGTGGASNGQGVVITGGGLISAGGSGTVTVSGTGGAGTGGGNRGIRVADASSQITSSGGDVTVTGQGGGTGGSGSNFGVEVAGGGTITAGDSGTVTVTGTGGAGTGNDNIGVHVPDASSQITSSGGDVTVVGQGGGTAGSRSNFGVEVVGGGTITAGDSGTVTVSGTGGAGTGNNNTGVRVWDANSQITSSGGAVTVVGLGGGTGDSQVNFGVELDNGGSISAGGTGSVSVTGTG
ncbi:MAG TPA: hypothetical protein PLF81_09100, partial [Candidatus Anammoximicrobium sp.]|nr:hypothetical protein [Candidatus Anammoximicrobium sp.]